MIEDKFMRVLLMFDVPTKSKKEQKLASKFRNNLIKLGYFMLQFSVYMRICKGLSSAKSCKKDFATLWKCKGFNHH